MVLQEEPTKKLREWVTRFIENEHMPNEAEIIQQVILGREIQDHPDCVDMSNVKGWYTMNQLGSANRDTFEAVTKCYKWALSSTRLFSDVSWINMIMSRLTEPYY